MSSSADTLTLLDRLVGFPSVAGHTNLPLMDFVEAHLAGAGFACRRIASEDGTRSNLFASIGPADRPGVVLSSHTDVVSTDEQDWSAEWPEAGKGSGGKDGWGRSGEGPARASKLR